MDPVLSAIAITHRYHSREILANVTLTLHRNTRVGLIGVNGIGKSTLLRILAGQEQPDAGDVRKERGLRIGYLHQDLGLNSAGTVREAIDEGLAEQRDLLAKHHELSQKTDEASLARLAEVQARIDQLGAWNLDWDVQRLMNHLQVPPQDRLVGELSGGERRRVTLCRTLIAKPDVLILDEPTNHLDSATIEWLEQYLAAFRGTLLLVTHDRYFLDRVTDHIIELDWGQVTPYEGNYSDYLEQKAARLAAQAEQERVRQRTLSRELEWVRKQPRARMAKSKSRVERYETLADQAPPSFHSDMDLEIPFQNRLGKVVLELTKVRKKMGDRTLIDSLTLGMTAGERIGVIGPNGVGKTTLMRMVMGQIAPDGGKIEVGQNTRFLYADQGRGLLNQENTVVQEVAGDSQWVAIGERTLSVRSYLRRFLFSDEQINTPIHRLSGGEMNRVQLAKLLREGANFLILDEPTNDLDLQTLRVLEDALVEFPGCALIVSHDRYFLNRVATGILAFRGDGTVVYTPGSYDRYLEQYPDPIQMPHEPSMTVETPVATPNRPMSSKEKNELKAIEGKIEAAEAELAALDVKLADGSLYTDRPNDVQALVEEQSVIRQRVDELYARWEELESLKASR
jgi:ATP-binding cassette subfamily F protein uup